MLQVEVIKAEQDASNLLVNPYMSYSNFNYYNSNLKFLSK